MKCLSNVERATYPIELVMDLTKLYQFKGKDFYYEDFLKNHLDGIIRTTVEADTLAFCRILKLNVTENRLKLLIRKDSKPKTKEEIVAKNLKEVFDLIQAQSESIELTTNEFLQLGMRIFRKHTRIDFDNVVEIVKVNLLEDKKVVSKRINLQEELNLYTKQLIAGKVETTLLVTNFYVDILNQKIFNEFNEQLSLLILYCLLFRQRFNVFKYISFFEMYEKHFSEFDKAQAKASYRWDTGYSNTDDLNKLIITMLIEGYEKVEKMVQDTDFDKKLNKIDNVKAAIMKLPQTFTKAQISQMYPYISPTTINRALASLQEEGKISSNGTGRSATWNKIVEDEIFNAKGRQITLFDLTEMKNDSNL